MNYNRTQENFMMDSALNRGEKEGYYGYEPVCVIDFPIQEDVFNNYTEEEDKTPVDDSKLEDKARTSNSMMVFIIICTLTFLLLFVSHFLVAYCKENELCEAIDVSSLITSEYRVVIPPFHILTVLFWIALSVGCLGVLLATIYAFIVLRCDVGTAKMVEMASIIRGGAFTFLSWQYMFMICPLGMFFFLVGGIVNWSSAWSFALGSTSCLVVDYFRLSMATRGNVRTCAATKGGLGKAMTMAYETGAMISLWLLGSGMVAVSAGYLMFSDVRALGGFAAGATLTTVMVRIAVGLFSNGTSTAATLAHGDEAGSGQRRSRKAHVVAPNVGTGIRSLFRFGPDVFDSLAGGVIGTAIIGASLPFFYHNPFAMCVFNHLHIDRECGSFRHPGAISFAANICLNEGLYAQYPSLSAWSSNSIFVAVPFVLGAAALLVSLITTSIATTVNKGNYKNGWKTVQCLRGNLLINCMLLISFSAAVCFGLFGPNSSFQHNVGMGPEEDLRRFDLDGSASQCHIRSVSVYDKMGNTLEPVPDRTREILDYYKPLPPSGISIGRPSSTASRLFGCNMLGILIGMLMARFSHVFFASARHGSTQRIAEVTKLGVAPTIIRGFATGLLCALPSTIVIILSILLSYKLYGSYGVGIMTVGFLSSVGHVTTVSGFGHVAENAERIAQLVKVPTYIQETTKVICLISSSTIGTGIEFSNGAAVLTAVTLLLAMVEYSNLLPFLHQLTGTSEEMPSRLIGSAKSISMIGNLLMGIVIPFILVGLLMLGAGRATSWISVFARRERKYKGTNRYQRFAGEAAQAALTEAIIPGAFAIAIPLAAVFGLGERNLFGLAAGTLGAGYVLGSSISAAGESWIAAERIVAENRKATDVSRRASKMAARFGELLRDCVAPLTSTVLKIGPVIGLVFTGKLRANSNQWWVGFVIVIVASVITLMLSIWKSVRNAKIVEDALKEEETRARLHKRKISPFHVDGKRANSSEVPLESEMANALNGLGSLHAPMNIRHLPGLSRRKESDVSSTRNSETLHVALSMGP